MRLIAFSVFAVLLTTSAVVQAEKITGKVIVTTELREAVAEANKKEAEAKKSYYWNEPNGIADVRLPRVHPKKDLAVVITREGAKPPGPNDVETIKIHAGSLERNVIVTRPGSTIKFKNVDPFDHSLYSPTYSSFKAEHQSNGAVRTMEFSEEGVFEIKCKLVPHFSAYVVVSRATIVVPMNADGTFAVTDVEPGKYLLRIFHDGKWLHSESFGVGGAKSREAKLSVSLKPAPPAAKEETKKTEKKDEKTESAAK